MVSGLAVTMWIAVGAAFTDGISNELREVYSYSNKTIPDVDEMNTR